MSSHFVVEIVIRQVIKEGASTKTPGLKGVTERTIEEITRITTRGDTLAGTVERAARVLAISSEMAG